MNGEVASRRSTLPAHEAERAQHNVAPRHGDLADEELVRRAVAGDAWAKGLIFRRHVREVGELATRLLGRIGDADDVVQDTFIAALDALDTLRDPASLRSWLLGIAVRRVLRRYRKQKTLRYLGLDRGVDDATLHAIASSDATPDQRTELMLIDRVLATVPAAARMAWMLRKLEGRELQDVASYLGISLATVKRWIASVDSHLEREAEQSGGKGLRNPLRLRPHAR